MEFLNHLSVGFDLITHKGKATVVGAGNATYDSFVTNLEDNYEFEIAYVIPEVEFRADLISFIFYNTPKLDWLILMANSIEDPFEELKVGTQLKIPII